MCIVEGANLHVAFTPSEYPEYPRTYTKLQGITFTGSTGWSVAAYDSEETTAEFVDCHWKNITGQTAIQIVEKDSPITSSNQTVARSQTTMEELTYLPGMTVKLKGCSFEVRQYIGPIKTLFFSLIFNSMNNFRRMYGGERMSSFL